MLQYVNRLVDYFKRLSFCLREWRYRRSYSQYGEDMLLRGFFKELGKWNWEYKGFYVDIGAYHPTRLSNTKIFSVAGWRGINVEPSKEAMQLFQKTRRRDINVHAGIAAVIGELDYYQFSCRPMNTFSKEFAELVIANGASLSGIEKVPVMTMEALLDTYLPEGVSIDFVSIDCEGLDFAILQSNNWHKYRPEFILVEIHTNGKNWRVQKGPIATFLRSVGYELVGQSFVTALFQRISNEERAQT